MFSKRIVLILFVVLVMVASIYAGPEDKTILFISRQVDSWIDVMTGEPGDMPHIWGLEGEGYNVEVVQYDEVLNLGSADQSVIDRLESADLVIMGRSTPSDMYDAPDKDAWNSLTVPILNIEPWAIRSNRLNWFNSTAMVNLDDAIDYDAIIEEPDDPVFEGINTDNLVPWTFGPMSLFQETEGGNALVLARTESDASILFARFEPFVEFYPGSIDMPFGPRTMIGNGSDNMRDADQNFIFNYYNFTVESEKVYYNEVARMLGLLGTSVEDEEQVVDPNKYTLSQNYPNPFNPSTTIEFTLSNPGYTTVDVRNVTGQLIETLVDGNLNAGLHSINFRADHLSAGLYFYSIRSNDFTDVKKMILLK